MESAASCRKWRAVRLWSLPVVCCCCRFLGWLSRFQLIVLISSFINNISCSRVHAAEVGTMCKWIRVLVESNSLLYWSIERCIVDALLLWYRVILSLLYFCLVWRSWTAVRELFWSRCCYGHPLDRHRRCRCYYYPRHYCRYCLLNGNASAQYSI